MISRPKLVSLGAIAIEVVLVVMHVLAQSSGHDAFGRLFHLSQEFNVPSWFSTIQLFLVAVALLTISFPRGSSPAALRWQLPMLGATFRVWRYDARVFLAAVLGAAVYLAGAVGIEFAGY